MPPRVAAIHPPCAIEGGRITIGRQRLSGRRTGAPRGAGRRHGGPDRLRVADPAGRDRAVRPRERPHHRQRCRRARRRLAFVDIAAPLAAGLHQVDNPIFDRDGNLYVTYSGTRGQQVPVSIFRVRPNGTREPFSSGIVNPTSMAIDPQGRLYVSSRFEGTVYRVLSDGTAEPFAHDLGVACGLAFSDDGTLFVGDRSGTIFKVDPHGQATTFAIAAGERRGLSPRVRPGRRAVRDRADAVLVRRAVPHRARRHGHDALQHGSAVRKGWPSIAAAPCSSSRRSPARAASIACRRAARRSWCCRARAWSASPSTPRARWSSRSNDTAYRIARSSATGH